MSIRLSSLFLFVSGALWLWWLSALSSSSLDTRVGVGRGTWTRRRRGFGGAARGRISARAMSRASTRMRGSQGMRLPGWGRFFCDGFGGIIMFRGAAAASARRWRPVGSVYCRATPRLRVERGPVLV